MLCTIYYYVTDITNFWELSCHDVVKDNPYKGIGTQYYTEKLF